MLANEEAVKEYNLTPLAQILGYSTVGVEPSVMGIGPVPAIQNLLQATGKNLQDVDLIEVRNTSLI